MTGVMIILAGLCAGIAMASAIGFDRGTPRSAQVPRVPRAPRVSRHVRRRELEVLAMAPATAEGRHLRLVTPAARGAFPEERMTAATMARPVLRVVSGDVPCHPELQSAERTGS